MTVVTLVVVTVMVAVAVMFMAVAMAAVMAVAGLGDVSCYQTKRDKCQRAQ
jgi:hypothetical protein